MKKIILIAALFAVFFNAFSQNSAFQKIESRRIDSLKKLLPLLKDTALVNCLNELSIRYGVFQGAAGMGQITDSMYHFAMLANDEANKIGYKFGVTVSLLNIARMKQYNGQNAVSNSYVNQALVLAKEIKNDQLLGRAYYLLANIEDQAENYKKAIDYFHKAGDIQQETEVTTWLCMSYSNKGEYEKGLPYCDKCIQLAKKNVQTDTSQWGHELVQWSLFDMAEIYKAAGDYETAMDYLLQDNQYAENNHLEWKMNLEISDLYCLMNKYDSALQNWKKWKENWSTYAWGNQANGNTTLGQIYLRTNQPEKVPPLLRDNIVTFRKKGKEMGDGIIRPLLFTGEAYAQLKNYPVALAYTKEAFSFAKENNARPYVMDSYELLSKIFHHLGNNDSAYEYLLKYYAIKDSIQNKQFLLRIYNYKKIAEDEKQQAQLLLLNKDNKLKTLLLKQESQQKNLLLILLSALVVSGFFVYRAIYLKRKNEKLKREKLENEFKLQQLENEKKQAELQQQAVELEMQALRAQMNPHFIFNCLSSINRIILKNESKTASDYLTRFSRLIRLVLINSQKAMIPLEDELQMLRLYLDMERLRFKNSFDYVISFVNEIDAGGILVPPLLLQPFCENAVWHGLMQKEGQGHLTIDLSMQDNILHCIIADDGIGRVKAAQLKSKSAEKEKSMGLEITTQRLALLNRDKQVQTFFTIEDIMDEYKNIIGTKVILKICYKELAEEFA